MADTCPICDIEMTQPHYCPDYDFTKFSIELELLDLPFSLEPYGHDAGDPGYAALPDITNRRSRNVHPERPISGFAGTGGHGKPLFIRL